MHKVKYIVFITLFFISIFSYAQEEPEFTIKKSPEEAKLESEKKKEKEYLVFQEHFFEAINQKAKEDYNKAIEELEDCKQIYPEDAGLNFEFAKNYLLVKDYDNAIYFDHKVLEVKPNNIHVLEHLKKIYKAQRDYDNAIKIQHKIIAIKPSKKSTLIHLYVANRDRNKAKELFLNLKKKHQIIENEAYYKRVLFPEKRVKTSSVSKVIKNTKSPKLPKPTKPNNTVKKEIKTPKVNTTNSSITQLQKEFIKTKKFQTLLQLIKKEEVKKEYEALAYDTKKGLELFPAQAYLYLVQGKAENKLAKYNEAINVLKAGLDFVIDNKSLETLFYEQIAKAYKGLGKRKEANNYLEKIKSRK